MNKKYPNLKRFGYEKPVSTHEEAERNGHFGGVSSGISRNETASALEYAKKILATETHDASGKKITYKEGVILRLVKKALGGDIRALELLLKIIGEMPNEKKEIVGANGGPIEITRNIDIEKIREIRDLLDGTADNG